MDAPRTALFLLALAAAALGPAASASASSPERPRLYLHFSDGADGNRDDAIRAGLLLQHAGFEVVDIRPVAAAMRQTTIRYFTAETRAAALRLKGQLEMLLAEGGIATGVVRVQDFTFYRPKPRPHGLEVWIRTR